MAGTIDIDGGGEWGRWCDSSGVSPFADDPSVDPLVEEACAGSDPAWHKIVEVLGPPVRGFARSRGASDPEALTQEVFLDAARGISGFDGDWAGFRSWIFTIAYRRLTDDRRRSGRRLPTTTIAGVVETADRGRSPEQIVLERETTDEILRGLDALKPIERDVVLLRVIGELSSEEVAEVIGKSPGNVRVIQNRAVQRLRKNLRRNV